LIFNDVKRVQQLGDATESASVAMANTFAAMYANTDFSMYVQVVLKG
jgi:hypothetical protein